MTRYLRRLAPLCGLVAAAVVAVSAAPASATVVCPPGVTPPSSYCSNVKPTAITGVATNINGNKATLNGTAGARVTGGDPTQWFFRWGTTTAYGHQTPTQTLGACPAGITPPSQYCSTPAAQGVSAGISGLTACTTYHFQLFATNPDGTTPGGDKTFRRGFEKPLKNFKTPRHVRRHQRFKVRFTLVFNAKVKVLIKRRRNGSILTTYNYGNLRAGNHTKTIRAPRRRGDYTLEVFARLSCGSQSIKHLLIVH
jgi:hypothetical protein